MRLHAKNRSIGGRARKPDNYKPTGNIDHCDNVEKELGILLKNLGRKKPVFPESRTSPI